jgi:hypothetical protein
VFLSTPVPGPNERVSRRHLKECDIKFMFFLDKDEKIVI